MHFGARLTALNGLKNSANHLIKPSQLKLHGPLFRPYQPHRPYSVITLKADGKLVKRKEENYAERQRFFDQLRPVIGLEVHAQLATNSKLFSFASYDYKSMPNTHVSHFDCSFPGTLPVLNEQAVRLAIKTGLAFGCEISKFCTFDRKHYFYPDMPQGYQITQQRNPIARNGELEFVVSVPFGTSYSKKVKLKQIQLEQDSGKSVVDTDSNKVFVDLNRVGVGLMEFVFDPELHSAEEAVSLLRELHLSLKWLGVCTGKMEEGTFRIDSNVSVHRPGEPFGTRVELKNLNSFKFVEEAIAYEVNRQKELLYANREVINETRHYNFKTKTTYSLRDKEVTQDYRFMPEPNLIPLRVYRNREEQLAEQKGKRKDECGIYLDDLRREIPKLPRDEREHLIQTYGFTLEQVYRLLFNTGFLPLFNYMMEKNAGNQLHSPARLVHFITGIVNSFLLERNRVFRRFNIPYDYFNECYDLLLRDQITEGTVVELLNVKQDELSSVDKTANEYLREYGWSKQEDQEFVRALVREVIQELPKEARRYQATQKKRMFNCLVATATQKSKRTVPYNLIAHVIDEILLVNREIEFSPKTKPAARPKGEASEEKPDKDENDKDENEKQ